MVSSQPGRDRVLNAPGSHRETGHGTWISDACVIGVHALRRPAEVRVFPSLSSHSVIRRSVRWIHWRWPSGNWLASPVSLSRRYSRLGSLSGNVAWSVLASQPPGPALRLHAFAHGTSGAVLCAPSQGLREQCLEEAAAIRPQMLAMLENGLKSPERTQRRKWTFPPLLLLCAQAT